MLFKHISTSVAVCSKIVYLRNSAFVVKHISYAYNMHHFHTVSFACINSGCKFNCLCTYIIVYHGHSAIVFAYSTC